MNTLTDKSFHISNKTEVLPVITRFFKERRCWAYFRDRCLNTKYHASKDRYSSTYGDKNFENGFENFLERLDSIPLYSFLSSRAMLCFEYDDKEFEGDYCEELNSQFRKTIRNSNLKI